MAVAQHLYELFLFLIIVCGPAPLCLQAMRISAPPSAPASLPQRLLVALTTWCLIQTIIALALGMLHGLALPWILTTELLVLLAGARRFTHGAARSEFRFNRNLWRELDDRETLTAIAVALVAVTLWWWALAMPVVDYDSWAFHLPAMVQWMQTGTFVRLDEYAQMKQGIYPYNWEALCTLFLAPFGEDFMVTFPNLIAWVLLGLSAYLLSRDFGAARIHALTSSALLIALPTIVIHVNSMHVDLPFAAFFLVSVHCGIAFHRTRTPAQLALCVATLGLLSGIRPTGPVYAAFVIAFLLAMRVGSRLWPRDVSKTIEPRPCGLPLTIVCGVSSLFLAGFWYVWNLIDYGNPLGIVSVEMGGVKLLPGAVPLTQYSSTTLASAFQPLQLSAWAALVNRVSGELGLPFLVILLEAATWPLALLTRRSTLTRDAITLLALLGGTGLLFWMTPFGAQTGITVRLGFPFVSMFAVAAATGASRVRLRPHVPVALALISAALVIAQSKILYVSVALLIVWGWWARRRPGFQRSRRAMLGTVCLLAAGIAAATFVARQRRDQERREFYGGFYDYLDRNVREDETLGYLFSARSYLFYGKHLRRRVLYVPYLSRPGEHWLDELRRRGVSIVALGPWSQEHDDVQLALHRLDDPNGPFVRIFGRSAPGEVTIYRRAASW